MQYARGVTLSQWRKQFPDGKVPLDKALEITRQIASALDYAHKERIIHRDIKPANVMVETLPDRSVTARVLDFGLAAEIRSSMGRLSLNVTDKSGTRHYMAPEQWSGKKQSKETDQYSLAALFYELILGEVPFASVFDTGDTILMKNVVENDSPEIPSDLPKSIRRALAKALSKKREDRFSSCIEFVDALQGGLISGARASSRAFFSRAAAIFTAVAALGLAGAGIWYWQDLKAKEEIRIAAEQKAAEANRRAAEEARIAAEKKAEEARIAAEKKAEEARIAAEKKAEEERRARKELASKISSDDKVQLWEGGPYWATRNIGAEKPEDYGYYFWWGDTVGYKREGDKWVASDRSNSKFVFDDDNDKISTSFKNISELESEGWIEEKNGTYVLTSNHDAARAHWGGAWRMPTKEEFDDLDKKCVWTWTTRNGKNGYVVRGRGNYASKSIFLPGFSFGNGDWLIRCGSSDGYYWSSVPYSDSNYDYAYGLFFDSGRHYGRRTDYDGRCRGRLVRPVQGFTK